MKTDVVERYLSTAQQETYRVIKNKLSNHRAMTHLAAIPAACFDIGLETIKPPLQAIEGLALVIINLLGKMFCFEECTIKGSLLSAEKSLTFAAVSPATFALAPVKLFYHVIESLFISNIHSYSSASQIWSVMHSASPDDRHLPELAATTAIVEKSAAAIQDQIYHGFGTSIRKHPYCGLLLSPLVALADTLVDTLKLPLAAIECVALAVINLLGTLFCSKTWTLKGCLICIEKAAIYAARIPVAVLLAPLQFIYQTVAILSDPKDTNPYHNLRLMCHRVKFCEKNTNGYAYTRAY